MMRYDEGMMRWNLITKTSSQTQMGMMYDEVEPHHAHHGNITNLHFPDERRRDYEVSPRR